MKHWSLLPFVLVIATSTGTVVGCGAASTEDAQEAGGMSGRGSGGAGAATGGAGSSGAATGGTSGRAGSGGGGAGASSVQCVGSALYFPEFDRTCSTAAECSVVAHETSCCGSQLLMGIRSDQRAAFDAAEAICGSQYPACGCAAQGIDVEDGNLIGFGQEDQVVATCNAGSCRARFPGGNTGVGGGTGVGGAAGAGAGGVGGGGAGGIAGLGGTMATGGVGTGGSTSCTPPPPPMNDAACPATAMQDGACDPIGLVCQYGGTSLGIANPCQGFSYTVAICCAGGFQVSESVSLSGTWPVVTCRP